MQACHSYDTAGMYIKLRLVTAELCTGRLLGSFKRWLLLRNNDEAARTIQLYFVAKRQLKPKKMQSLVLWATPAAASSCPFQTNLNVRLV